MSDLYTISPLKWERVFSDYCQLHQASVGFGVYYIERCKDDDDVWMPWKWGYCFDEYYDEEYTQVQSVKEGKRLCWENWLQRILPCLDERREPSQ